MSFFTVAKGLTGKAPDTPLSLAKEAVQDALGVIFDQTDWSFQRSATYGQWLCPGNVANVGTFTTTPYLPTVTADATATMVLDALVAPPFLTTLQFRNPEYSIYNIIGVGVATTVAYPKILTPGSGQTPGIHIVNGVGGTGTGAQATIIVTTLGTVTATPVMINPGTGYTPAGLPTFTLAAGGIPATFLAVLNTVLTLDRPWLEPLRGPGQNYQIYQAYFVAPVQDFRKFIEVRDTTNSAPLNFWSLTQADLAIRDPQRTEFADPSYVVPMGVDQRPGSATLGWPMFELWPQQLSYIPYSFSFRRRGAIPQTISDFQSMTTPYPITEEMLKWRALEVLYQFKEAQKDKSEARGSGANWPLLAQMAEKEYARIYSEVLSIDLNLNGEMITRIPGRDRNLSNGPYSNQLGQLNIGGYPSRD